MLYSSVNFQPSTSIATTDRGLAFGDGIFTTGKIIDGQLEYIVEHIERLKSGCARLGISTVDWDKLSLEMIQAAQITALGCLKVIISAGQQGRGYSRKGCSAATIVVSVTPFPVHYLQWQQQGITLGVSSFKLGLNPTLSGLKHLNRLEQVLIRNEMDAWPVDEVVVCDLNEHIIECNTANIFWIKNSQVYTPNLENSGVEGIIRKKIINHIGNVSIVSATLSCLYDADAVFITNSLMGVVSVNRCNNYYYDHKLVASLLGNF